MISPYRSLKLPNGHEIDFLASSGALAFHCEGWWFEQPWRWLGLLRPRDLTIITKTLTYFPRKGNLKHWCPWRCVQRIEDGTVNAVGLTNPGYLWWIDNCYDYVVRKGYKVIVSVMPENNTEANNMAACLDFLPDIVGVELNLSCPNVDHRQSTIDDLVKMVEEFCILVRHPVIVKLGYEQPYLEICQRLEKLGYKDKGKVAAIDLINSVPWDIACPGETSPLAKYGLKGAVSGRRIIPFAREALAKVKIAGISIPVISGGGINSYAEVNYRMNHGADAVAFGSLFMDHTSYPNKIAKEWRGYHA